MQVGNCLLDSKFVKKKKKIKVNRSLGDRKHSSIRAELSEVFHSKEVELKVEKTSMHSIFD